MPNFQLHFLGWVAGSSPEDEHGTSLLHSVSHNGCTKPFMIWIENIKIKFGCSRVKESRFKMLSEKEIYLQAVM